MIVEQEDNNILLELAHCLWKHMLGMGIIFTTIMVLVIISTSRQIPIYEIGSRLMIKFGRDYIYHSNEGGSSGDLNTLIGYDSDKAANTEIEIIRSRELVEEVLTAIGVNTLFPKLVERNEDKDILWRKAVYAFLDALDVVQIKESTIIQITFQHSDPEVAVLAVSDLISRYKARHIQIFKDPRFEFLETRVADLSQKLRIAQDVKHDYKVKNGVYDIVEQRTIVMRQYGEVRTMLVKEMSLLDGLREKKQSFKKEIEKVDKEIVLDNVRGDRNIQPLQLELLQRKRSRRQLSSKYPDNNRLIVALDDEIKLTQQVLDSALNRPIQKVRRGPSVQFQTMKGKAVNVTVEYEGQLKKVESIQKQIALLKEELEVLTEREIVIHRLDSIQKIAKRDYTFTRAKLAQSSIQELMDSAGMISVVVIDKPMVPHKPIRPNKKLRLLVGLIMAVASSFFYALFREYVMVPKK